jgi:hypothetical protein
MGARKIPPDAFDIYLSLGPKRSYQAVAEKLGVAKRSVTAVAKREDWQGRVQKVEAKAREAVDQKATETLAAMKERHLRMLEVVQAKALQALKTMPIETAYQAVRALATAIEQERLARGEPSERTAVEIEAMIRREHDMVLLKPGEKEDWGAFERPSD